MSLFTGGDIAIAIENGDSGQLINSVRVFAFGRENVGALQRAAKASDSERGNHVQALIGGCEGFDGHALAVARNDRRGLVVCSRTAGSVQRRERAAVGVVLAEQYPIHAGAGWIVADHGGEGSGGG